MRILVVDDSEGIRSSIRELLRDRNEVVLAGDGEEAFNILKSTPFDLVITDNNMPKLVGLELIRQAKQAYPETSFILMTALSAPDEAVEALAIGADDSLGKPFQFAEVLHRVERIEAFREWTGLNRLSKALANSSEGANSDGLGKSELEFAAKVAPEAYPVLILGNDHSNKTQLAQLIHRAGKKSVWPVVSIECRERNPAELTRELLGAPSQSGWLELAGGTLVFLNIDKLSQDLQNKLTLILKDKTFCPEGSARPINLRARILATGCEKLETLAKSGSFSLDLWNLFAASVYQMPSAVKLAA
jgi:two-component system, NtrC family, response regulator PilR